MTWFAWLLATSLALLLIGLLAAGVRLTAPIGIVLAFAVAALIAEKQSVEVARHVQASVSVLPLLFAAVVFGPLAGILVGVCAHVGELGRPYTRWAVWTSSHGLAGGFAGLAALMVPGTPDSFLHLLLAVGVAAVTEVAVDTTLVSATVALRRRTSIGLTARSMLRFQLGAFPLQLFAIAVLAYAYLKISPLSVLLFAVPALACQRFLSMYQQERMLSADLQSANTRLRAASESFASALVATLDARDHYTAGHSAAVAVYARDMARQLSHPEDEQRLVYVAALLHDIGKVGLPPGILEKAGPLTLLERQQMQEHSVMGQRILEHVDDYAEVAIAVRHHHERVDGGGYPDGLSGREIPLVARIIAVADAYSAMTSGRAYREALFEDVARARLRDGAGTQFDPELVRIFEASRRRAGSIGDDSISTVAPAATYALRPGDVAAAVAAF